MVCAHAKSSRVGRGNGHYDEGDQHDHLHHHEEDNDDDDDEYDEEAEGQLTAETSLKLDPSH